MAGTPGCKLIGPAGEVEITHGVIAAKRHIHFNPEEAQQAGVTDKQIVSVKLDYNGRSLVFGDVVCRVSPKYALAMHIDTDESNAAGLPGTVDRRNHPVIAPRNAFYGRLVSPVGRPGGFLYAGGFEIPGKYGIIVCTILRAGPLGLGKQGGGKIEAERKSWSKFYPRSKSRAGM